MKTRNRTVLGKKDWSYCSWLEVISPPAFEPMYHEHKNRIEMNRVRVGLFLPSCHSQALGPFEKWSEVMPSEFFWKTKSKDNETLAATHFPNKQCQKVLSDHWSWLVLICTNHQVTPRRKFESFSDSNTLFWIKQTAAQRGKWHSNSVNWADKQVQKILWLKFICLREMLAPTKGTRFCRDFSQSQKSQCLVWGCKMSSMTTKLAFTRSLCAKAAWTQVTSHNMLQQKPEDRTEQVTGHLLLLFPDA